MTAFSTTRRFSSFGRRHLRSALVTHDAHVREITPPCGRIGSSERQRASPNWLYVFFFYYSSFGLRAENVTAVLFLSVDLTDDDLTIIYLFRFKCARVLGWRISITRKITVGIVYAVLIMERRPCFSRNKLRALIFRTNIFTI